MRLPSRREDGVLAWDSLIGARNALLDQLEAKITGADMALVVSAGDSAQSQQTTMMAGMREAAKAGNGTAAASVTPGRT